MATTLYGNFPLLLPNKTVSVSLYGLQKTSGTILFKPGQEAFARDLAEQEGAVFPDPQVRRTDMGLLEMSFDAYIDTGARSGVFGAEVLNLSKSFNVIVEQGASESGLPALQYNYTVTEVWLTDSYTERKVLSATLGSAAFPSITIPLGRKRLKRFITGTTPNQVSYTSELTITWTNQVSSVTRRNFGTFDEVDIVSSLTATIA